MSQKRFRFLFLTASLFFAGSAFAQETALRVKSPAALQEAINKARPGDQIVLENGTYSTDGPIKIDAQGAPDRPIVVSAATVGGVELQGTAGFSVGSTAAYVTIRGFVFTHESGTNRIEAGAKFCRFTRNLFECKGKGAYLTVSGDDCQIDYNTFRHKSTEGQMISVQGPGSSGMAQRTWIHHNHFFDFKPTSNNCGSIQVGLSGRSLSPAHTLVEHNLFSQTRGENENICNKSCDNIYRYNTFGEGVSELSLRHGNRCQVYGNFFIGSEGLRFFGHRHQIFSNYFERCNPAINIGNGDGIVPRDKLTSHDRPDTVQIVGNTLCNNVRNVIMQGRKEGLGATCITFADNIIQGGGAAAQVEGNIVNPVWEGNIIWKTNGAGTLPSGGYTEADPGLKQESTVTMHLQANSRAIGQARGDYPFVTVDIDGQARSGKLDVGADQVTTTKEINHPLRTNEVGTDAKP